MIKQTKKELQTTLQGANQDLKSLPGLVLLNGSSARVLQGHLKRVKARCMRKLIEGNYIIKHTEKEFAEVRSRRPKT